MKFCFLFLRIFFHWEEIWVSQCSQILLYDFDFRDNVDARAVLCLDAQTDLCPYFPLLLCALGGIRYTRFWRIFLEVFFLWSTQASRCVYVYYVRSWTDIDIDIPTVESYDMWKKISPSLRMYDRTRITPNSILFILNDCHSHFFPTCFWVH